MAAMFHILKRDMRASWNLLCVIPVLLALQVFQAWNIRIPENLDTWSIRAGGGLYGPIDTRQFPEAFPLLLLYLAIMTIIVRVIQEDSLVGASAFWLTRPISRKSLLGAKALYASLFLVLAPVLANCILLLHHGMRGSQILPFLFDNLRVYLPNLFFFAVFAVVTPNWVSFAIAEVMALIFLYIASTWFAIPYGPVGGFSGMSIFGLLLFAVTLVTIIHQFLTRKTRRSIAFLIAGTFLAWTCCRYLALHSPFDHQIRKAASCINIVASVKPANPAFYRYFDHGPTIKPIIASIEFQNVPASEEAVLTTLDGHLEFTNGERISYNGDSILIYGSSQALRPLLPGLTWILPGEASPQIQLLSVSERVYKDLSARPGTYSGNLKFDLFRDDILTELPLAVGRRIDLDPQPIVITSMLHQPETGNLSVYVEQRGLMLPDNYKDSIFYCLANRVRQQALAPLLQNVVEFSINRSMVLSGVDWRYKKWALDFYASHYKTPSIFKIDEAWLKDARLVIIQRRFLGTFERKFEINNFRMQDYTVEKQQALTD